LAEIILIGVTDLIPVPPLKSSQAFGMGRNLTKGFFTFQPGLRTSYDASI